MAFNTIEFRDKLISMARNNKRRRVASNSKNNDSNKNGLLKKTGLDESDNTSKSKSQKHNHHHHDNADESALIPPHCVATFYVDYDNDNNRSINVPPVSAHCSLKDLIHPLSVQDFLDDYFQPYTHHNLQQQQQQRRRRRQQQRPPQKAVHFTCKAGQESQHSQRVKDLVENEMLNLDPKRLLQETSSDSIFIWLRPQTATTTSPSITTTTTEAATKSNSNNATQQKLPLLQSMEVADVSNALALLQCGHASYCRAPPAVEQPLVASLLRDTGFGCGQYDPSGNSTRCLGRGEVEVFITTAANSSSSLSSLHATDWHFDFQENFTIQLSGKKRWTLQSGTIPFPLRACTPHYASPASVEGQLQAAHLVDRKFQFGHPTRNVNAVGDPHTILLQPGDVMYFPAGMWHQVECIEPGVSINVSLMATNYANLVCQSLQHLLLQRGGDEWRRTVASHPSHPDGILQHLQQLLQDLPHVIQSLSENHDLPKCILPPILQFPTKFLTTAENESDDDDDDEKEDDDDGEEMEVVEEQEEEEEEESGLVVCVSDFEAPLEWKKGNDQKQPGTRLIKNPLARLTRMDEISSFYGQRNDKDATLLFVLHVNYAGNEMLESAIRIVLRDDPTSKCLNRLYESLEQDKQQSHSSTPLSSPVVLKDAKLIAEHERLIDCMLFYGYLQWTSSNENVLTPTIAIPTTTVATSKKKKAK